jgi:hypothetical protein
MLDSKSERLPLRVWGGWGCLGRCRRALPSVPRLDPPTGRSRRRWPVPESRKYRQASSASASSPSRAASPVAPFDAGKCVTPFRRQREQLGALMVRVHGTQRPSCSSTSAPRCTLGWASRSLRQCPMPSRAGPGIRRARANAPWPSSFDERVRRVAAHQSRARRL